MALLDDVKSELAAFEGDSPAAIKAQAAAMIRFGGGLRPVQNAYVIQAVFTSLDAAEWLQNTLKNVFGHEAEVNHLTRQTPNGPVETYVVLVTRNVVALALQTGLVDRRKQQVRGLPAEVVNGSIAQIKAAWRGAFMARGFLSDPGKASFLEIACPTEEANLSAQYIGSEQIDNLNSGFEHLGLRFQLIERGRIAVNRPTFFNIEGLALFQVEAVAGHVKYVSLGNIAYRNRNGSSRIGYLLSAHQPVSGLKR